MNISELKTLLISAKNNINSQLKLNKTKDIKYSETKYFEEVSFLSLFNCCAEDGSETMNFIDTLVGASYPHNLMEWVGKPAY